jgi:hypothetical protein
VFFFYIPSFLFEIIQTVIFYNNNKKSEFSHQLGQRVWHTYPKSIRNKKKKKKEKEKKKEEKGIL